MYPRPDVGASIHPNNDDDGTIVSPVKAKWSDLAKVETLNKPGDDFSNIHPPIIGLPWDKCLTAASLLIQTTLRRMLRGPAGANNER